MDALENKPKGIELVAVGPAMPASETVSATVFIPEAAADFFSRKVEAYRDEQTKGGAPKNQNLVARIEDVRLGAARALFTDAADQFPADDQPRWWEVWLRDDGLQTFKTVAARLNVTVKDHSLNFPERDVVLALAGRSHAGSVRAQFRRHRRIALG